MKMKTWRQGILMAFVLAVFGMIGFVPSEVAAAEALITEVPVQITLSGTLPEAAEDFSVVLKADDASNPMPQGSADGACTLVISGENTESFPVIRFSKVGIYHYTISQQSGSNADCTYDNSVYRLTVTVTNDEAGGLGAISVLYRNEESEKLDCAVFANVYVTEPETETESETEPETETEKQTAKQTETDKSSAPKTGDSSNLALWIALMIAAAIIVSAVFFARKKQQAGNGGKSNGRKE